MKNVLFVCTGNTCRSPMAEALLRSKLIHDIDVKSAGVYADNGSKASIQTQQVLLEKGIEFEHSSSLLTEEHMGWADYILTMTNSHKQLIIGGFPLAYDKVFTFKEFVGLNGDISDPFGGPIELYRETYEEMEPLIAALIKQLT